MSISIWNRNNIGIYSFLFIMVYVGKYMLYVCVDVTYLFYPGMLVYMKLNKMYFEVYVIYNIHLYILIY